MHMAFRANQLDARLGALDASIASLDLAGAVAGVVARWRGDVASMRFHLAPRGDRPIIVSVLGGTGTGKSTLVNRLLGGTVTAASFRRTFTAGAIAVACSASAVPEDWLGIEHVLVDERDLPARGRSDALVVAIDDRPLTRRLTIIDTPDLDGDHPPHHAQADRAFRWTDAVLFAVTPEKYQMTELLPYYRLARRYAVPALFVMNKCEEAAVYDDYRAQLVARLGITESSQDPLRVFAVPRDDAAYQPPEDADLDAMRAALLDLRLVEGADRDAGLAGRASDLIGRFSDQILAPLRDMRSAIDASIASLRAMVASPADIDVNPITQQLQRRLQQRSVLYLMGPRRMIERVRQVPALLARLPRNAWDLVMTGKASLEEPTEAPLSSEEGAPDFHAALVDQFRIVQSRVDDSLRSSPSGSQWIADNPAAYAESHLDPHLAGQIADEELADLRSWLQDRWNATPRDTAILNRLLRHIPGGKTLTRWSEAAPYLLAIVVATHNAMFGPIDLVVIGGFSLATWISEKLSNEVANRTRLANRRINERFERLVTRQIERTIAWLDGLAPGSGALNDLSGRADAIAESVERS